MKYHYRIREIRWNPEKPSFVIEITWDNWVWVKLGWADWYLSDGQTPHLTLESAKKDVLARIEADKASKRRAKETKTRYHYL